MKRSEMNAHQQLAFDHICHVMSEWIGGMENILEDCDDTDEEYINAKNYLSQSREILAQDIYDEVMSQSDKPTEKHLRFAGKDFIMERINRRLEKWGY